VQNAAALGVDHHGRRGAALVTGDAYSLPPAPPQAASRGDSATKVKELVRLLRQEAKVI
jgi:hypothetical protein